jgi:hypothetical protein
MGGYATVEQLLGRALPARCSKPRRQPIERWEEDGAAAAPFVARTPTDGWTCHRQVAPRQGPTHAHPQDLGAAVFWPSTTRWPELRQHLSHGAPSTGGDHGEARARSRSCASRSIHPACGSTTAGGSGHGIFTKGESRNLLLHLLYRSHLLLFSSTLI